jgi:hypothetical protein
MKKGVSPVIKNLLKRSRYPKLLYLRGYRHREAPEIILRQSMLLLTGAKVG